MDANELLDTVVKELKDAKEKVFEKPADSETEQYFKLGKENGYEYAIKLLNSYKTN